MNIARMGAEIVEKGSADLAGAFEAAMKYSQATSAFFLNDATDADLPAGPGTVFSYRIRMQQGTVRFSDRDTTRHPELAQAELFAAQTAQSVCGLSG